MLHVIK
nr:unnamed protein product [Callosobruchus analis]